MPLIWICLLAEIKHIGISRRVCKLDLWYILCRRLGMGTFGAGLPGPGGRGHGPECGSGLPNTKPTNPNRQVTGGQPVQ